MLIIVDLFNGSIQIGSNDPNKKRISFFVGFQWLMFHICLHIEVFNFKFAYVSFLKLKRKKNSMRIRQLGICNSYLLRTSYFRMNWLIFEFPASETFCVCQNLSRITQISLDLNLNSKHFSSTLSHTTLW